MSSLIALLGRTSKPACGIADYCNYLGTGFAGQGVHLENVQVNWAELGWCRALLELWHKSSDWKNKWVLLQYTAGAWSRYGFPLAAIAVIAILRQRGAHCAVTFHEPWRWEGTRSRWIDRLRGACQDWVIRRVYRLAERAVFPDPLAAIDWLPKDDSKSVFIPIGANVPEPDAPRNFVKSKTRTVAIFCLSNPPNLHHELEEIASALRFSSDREVQLKAVFLGRGTSEAKEQIHQAFVDTRIEVTNLGIQSAKEVSDSLSKADVMLCVRGRLFPRRGSALAGIACGVPVIAYEGPAQQTPFGEAGVEFVPYRDHEMLGKVLLNVLTDENLQQELRQKNRRSMEMHFSWNRIATQYVEALGFARDRSQYSTKALPATVAEAKICAS